LFRSHHSEGEKHTLFRKKTLPNAPRERLAEAQCSHVVIVGHRPGDEAKWISCDLAKVIVTEKDLEATEVVDYSLGPVTMSKNLNCTVKSTPSHAERLRVFHSARAIFCARSNPTTTAGMYHGTIWTTPSWNQGEIHGPRYDCIYVSNSESNMSGLLVAHILLFYPFVMDEELHRCAHFVCDSR
jgi:hypothetical protein